MNGIAPSPILITYAFALSFVERLRVTYDSGSEWRETTIGFDATRLPTADPIQPPPPATDCR